jgi:bifunctional DNA-binding transcriptional regulator/antitoxin component of YhaV-PrlF toxin-antitoxin module
MKNVRELEKEIVHMVKPKRISVSSKRQITIPKEYYEDLQISEEVLCQVIDGALVIKPVGEEVDFSQYILRDLINEGYEGEELLHEFSNRKSQIRPAIKRMITESRDNKVYSNTEDFFNELDEDEDE